MVAVLSPASASILSTDLGFGRADPVSRRYVSRVSVRMAPSLASMRSRISLLMQRTMASGPDDD
jgi:hypothetical protein